MGLPAPGGLAAWHAHSKERLSNEFTQNQGTRRSRCGCGCRDCRWRACGHVRVSVTASGAARLRVQLRAERAAAAVRGLHVQLPGVAPHVPERPDHRLPARQRPAGQPPRPSSPASTGRRRPDRRLDYPVGYVPGSRAEVFNVTPVPGHPRLGSVAGNWTEDGTEQGNGAADLAFDVIR